MTNSHQSGDPPRRPSTRALEAVAEAEGVEATDLPPLYETVDPDAIDDAVQSGCTVSFDYVGYTVEVRGPEEVRIRDA